MTKDLVISQISKSFGRTDALKDVSFVAHAGEVVGLLGENGAGKSTLLRILGGTLEADTGFVTFRNEEMSNCKRRNLSATLFGNNVGLYGDLTARENIEFFARLRGLDVQSADVRLKDLAIEFGMVSYLDKKVLTLSKGMKQKVAIVRSIIHSPSIILFDEPASGLDFASAKTACDFLQREAREGKVAILSSHSVGDVIATCDRIAVLHKGSLIGCYSVKELTSDCSLEEAYQRIFNLVK